MISTRNKLLVAAGMLSILAVGVFTSLGTWRVTVTERIASTAKIDVTRLHVANGKLAFDVTAMRFSRDHVAAALVDLDEGQTLTDVAGDATLTINGGYFDSAFAPLGLYRINGDETSPMLARPPLSGVVTIDVRRWLHLVTRDDADVASARSAFQAGPFLIDPGGALGIRGDDGKLAERTVIAIDATSLVVLVATPTTLHALAECLHDRPEAFGLKRVDRALNLDGGPSTGFVLNVDGRRIESLPRGRIRSAVTFRVQ